MKLFNICIDIDGTITEPYYWLDRCNKYFKTNVAEDQITEYYIHHVLGITRKEYEDFYENYKFEIHSNQRLRDDVQEIIKLLSVESNVYFVTARDSSLKMLTYSYLKQNEIPYDDLFILGSHYKVDTAIQLNCSVFIEDNYDNALQLSNAGFKVLLLDTNYNRKPLTENITRVYDWQQIYSNIKKMLLQSKAV